MSTVVNIKVTLICVLLLLTGYGVLFLIKIIYKITLKGANILNASKNETAITAFCGAERPLVR